MRWGRKGEGVHRWVYTNTHIKTDEFLNGVAILIQLSLL